MKENARPMYQRRITKLPVFLQIPAWIAIGCGLVVLTGQNWGGLLLVFVGLTALTMQSGIRIDFNRKRVQLYGSVFGVKFGKWEVLPAVDRMTLVAVNQPYTASDHIGRNFHLTRHYFEVRLYPAHSRDHYVAATGAYDSVKTDADFLSRQTGVPYEDFTRTRQ